MSGKTEWEKNASKYLQVKSSSVDAYKRFVDYPSLIKLVSSHAKLKKAVVLDAGCGDGIFTKLLAKRYADVVGVDISNTMVSRARATFPTLRFSVGDISKDLTDLREHSFDVIVLAKTLMYVHQLEQAVNNLSRLIKTGGIVAVDLVHPVRPSILSLRSPGMLEDPKDKHDNNVPYGKEIKGRRRYDSVYFTYYYRPLSYYVNLFLKHGFVLLEMREPQGTSAFFKKHPEYRTKKDTPVSIQMIFKSSKTK